MSYGFTCFNCETMLETPYRDGAQAESYASEHGWMIGHFNGQGYIVCGNCENTIWGAVPLRPNSRPNLTPKMPPLAR